MATVSARHGLKLSGAKYVVPCSESAVYGRTLSVIEGRARMSCTSRSKDEPFATWRQSYTRGPRLTCPRYRLSTGRLEINSSKEVEIKVKEKSSRDVVDLLPSEPEVTDGRLPAGAQEGEFGWQAAFPHAATSALANLCFGYHIGIFNGPLDSVAAELGFAHDTLVQGFVVSIFLVGAFIGSFGGGLLADLVGRRRNFQLDAIPLILGSVVSANADSVEQLALGRLLVGIGVGAASGFVALYISEVAPTRYRGALGCLPQVGTCLGIIIALLLGLPSETDPHWWRVMFWIANVPAVALAVGMQFAAESPRWLTSVRRLPNHVTTVAMNLNLNLDSFWSLHLVLQYGSHPEGWGGQAGKWEQARDNLEHLWGPGEAETAMNALRDVEVAGRGVEEATWAELFSPKYYKVAVIGGLLFVAQQFAGINGVLYFSSATFKGAGVANGMLASAAVGVANLAGALTVIRWMDSQGRKVLLMGSYAGMAVCMFSLVAALLLPMPESVSHVISVAGTLGYVYTFALGAGPATALIIPELCSTRIRAKTLAFSLCVHWVCNFVIGLFFLHLVQRFGVPVIYSSFGIVSLLSIAFTNTYIIETKGRSLEEIEKELNPELESPLG